MKFRALGGRQSRGACPYASSVVGDTLAQEWCGEWRGPSSILISLRTSSGQALSTRSGVSGTSCLLSELDQLCSSGGVKSPVKRCTFKIDVLEFPFPAWVPLGSSGDRRAMVGVRCGRYCRCVCPAGRLEVLFYDSCDGPVRALEGHHKHPCD